MLKTITVPVREVKLPVSDYRIYSDTVALNKLKEDECQRIFDTYKMLVPTHLQLHLSQELVKKMYAIKNLSNLHGLKKVEFYSSDRTNNTNSFAYVLNNNLKIETTYYEESGKFPCYNSEFFRLVYDSFYEKFCVKFHYVNSYSEHPFSTHYFDLTT